MALWRRARRLTRKGGEPLFLFSFLLIVRIHQRVAEIPVFFCVIVLAAAYSLFRAGLTYFCAFCRFWKKLEVVFCEFLSNILFFIYFFALKNVGKKPWEFLFLVWKKRLSIVVEK